MAELSFAFAVGADLVEEGPAPSVAAGEVRRCLRAAGLPEADLGAVTVEVSCVALDGAGRALFTVTVSGPLPALGRIFDCAEGLGWGPEEG